MGRTLPYDRLNKCEEAIGQAENPEQGAGAATGEPADQKSDGDVQRGQGELPTEVHAQNDQQLRTAQRLPSVSSGEEQGEHQRQEDRQVDSEEGRQEEQAGRAQLQLQDQTRRSEELEKRLVLVIATGDCGPNSRSAMVIDRPWLIVCRRSV